MPLVAGLIAANATDRLNEIPVPLWIRSRPVQPLERHLDDLWTPAVRSGLKEFGRDLFAGVALEQPSGFFHLVQFRDHRWLQPGAARKQQSFDAAVLVIPCVAQRPARSIDIGVGIGATVEQ